MISTWGSLLTRSVKVKENRVKREDGSEEESDCTETVDEMIKESKPNTKMKNKGSTHKSEVTEMKEIYQELLKTVNSYVIDAINVLKCLEWVRVR